MFEKLIQTSNSLVDEFDVISGKRKDLLNELSIYIKGKLASNNEVSLIFICTHNSRRSHMAQVWAQAAAHYFGIKEIRSYSGGTQKTSFNKAAIKALLKSGFKISTEKEGKNPRYLVRFDKKAEPISCFSKKYDHKKNPSDGFVAIMTCSDADEACPIVTGADYRTTIKYEDPKKSDGTNQQEQVYQERCQQIGREMFYVFSQVALLMKN